MMQRIQLAFFVPLCVALFATPTALPVRAFAGSLMGDVFVTMKGDVKRAAGVEVLIVSATTRFDHEWERLQNEYEEGIKPVVAEYESLEAREESLRLRRESPYTPGTSVDRQIEETRRRLMLSQQSAALVEQMMRLGRERWRPLQESFTLAAIRLVEQRATARIPTDVNGHFVVNLPSGRYYLVCRYQLAEQTMYWLVPAHVQDNTRAKISLSSQSATRSPLRGRTWTNL
jgi:hypothetical protein